jgi:hypothetical protein
MVASVDSPPEREQASAMKPTILAILLLASAFTFGQKFQDVSAKGAPASLSGKHDDPEMGPYAAARKISGKTILAMVAVVRATDEHGRVFPCSSHMDYAFKIGAMAPQEERFACMMGNPHDKSAKIANVEAAVLFVQFEDGSTWGDDQAGKGMLAERPQKLAYLKRLVETYYESGDAAFAALLDEPEPMSPEFTVASCLKGEADEKTSTIDLAKKRLAAGLQWHASGIF